MSKDIKIKKLNRLTYLLKLDTDSVYECFKPNCHIPKHDLKQRGFNDNDIIIFSQLQEQHNVELNNFLYKISELRKERVCNEINEIQEELVISIF
jgi:hypothetical protein